MVKLNQEFLVEDGLKEMKELHQDYQDLGKGSDTVRRFLATAFKDEALLKRYLIGRKYRPKHAWETLRSYAEVRLEKYPEMFPDTLPPKEYMLCGNTPIVAILKGRDSQGRRIGYFQAGAWDPHKCTLEDLVILTLPIFEKLLHDDDCMNNGLVFIQETSGVGLAHAKHYTLGVLLRLVKIYWHSFPLKIKGVYIVNVISVLTYIYSMVKPFLPKKLKERILLSTTNRNFKDLHETISPEILPRCLGGNLDPEQANDSQFII